MTSINIPLSHISTLVKEIDNKFRTMLDTELIKIVDTIEKYDMSSDELALVGPLLDEGSKVATVITKLMGARQNDADTLTEILIEEGLVYWKFSTKIVNDDYDFQVRDVWMDAIYDRSVSGSIQTINDNIEIIIFVGVIVPQ